MSLSKDEFRRLRKAKGITQQELAARAKVGIATIQNIEAGKANPELSTIEAVLSALGFKLAIRAKTLDWQILAVLGAPLMAESTESRFTPNANDLIEVLNQSAEQLILLKPNSREGASILGLLTAIRDHYPSLLGEIDPVLTTWMEKNLRSASIKLRRLALQRLGEYL